MHTHGHEHRSQVKMEFPPEPSKSVEIMTVYLLLSGVFTTFQIGYAFLMIIKNVVDFFLLPQSHTVRSQRNAIDRDHIQQDCTGDSETEASLPNHSERLHAAQTPELHVTYPDLSGYDRIIDEDVTSSGDTVMREAQGEETQHGEVTEGRAEEDVENMAAAADFSIVDTGVDIDDWISAVANQEEETAVPAHTPGSATNDRMEDQLAPEPLKISSALWTQQFQDHRAGKSFRFGSCNADGPVYINRQRLLAQILEQIGSNDVWSCIPYECRPRPLRAQLHCGVPFLEFVLRCVMLMRERGQ